MSRVLLVSVLALIAAGAPAEPQQPVFSARTALVRVDVSATEHGRPVKDLRPSDFDVRDNGVRQEVEFLLAEKTPLSVALVLDVSGSVAGERLDHLRNALDGVLGRLRTDDQVGLVTFSHQLSIVSAPAADRDRLRARLAAARGSGGTSLFDAAQAGVVLADSDESRGLVLIFSDGLDTSSWLLPDRVLGTAKRGQVVSYAVSPRGTLRDHFLHDLTDLTGGSYLEVDSTKDLGQAFDAILEEFRHRYLLSYRPAGLPTAGWHRIDVNVRRPGVLVRARRGYVSQQ